MFLVNKSFRGTFNIYAYPTQENNRYPSERYALSGFHLNLALRADISLHNFGRSQ
jgi:hypothetical protein